MSVRRTVFVTVVGVLGVVAVQRMSVGVPAAAVAVNNAETNVVRDCGAVPDGSTDNLAVLQDCITQAESTGRSLYFPPGTYNVNGTLEITKDNFSIRGANRATTSLVETKKMVNLFEASAGPDSVLSQLSMRGLRLSYSMVGASGTALQCVNCSRTFIQDMIFGTVSPGHGGATSLSFINSGSKVGDSIHVLSSTFFSPGLRAIYVSQASTAMLQDVDIHLDAGNAEQQGLVIDSGVTRAYATNVHVSGGANGFVLRNTIRTCDKSGAPALRGSGPCRAPSFGFFSTCFAENQNGTGGAGWRLEAGTSITLASSGASGAATNGLSAANVDGLGVGDGRFYGNGHAGVLVSASKDVDIHDSRIAGNSYSVPGTYPGIFLDSAANQVALQNNRVGPIDGYGNTQGYGATVASGFGDSLLVKNNDLSGNLSGGLLVLGTRGAHWSTQAHDWG